MEKFVKGDGMIIHNNSLRSFHIPPDNATWELINEFAHTFDGYKELGGFDQCAGTASRRDPRTLTEIRACLFFEARSWRHGSEDPDEENMKYLRELVTKIRTAVLHNKQS